MFIHEAAKKSLQELGTPTHVSKLYHYIEESGYYKFGAQEPENALAIQLSRRSSNVVIGHSNPDKLFYRAAPATYGLIDWLDSGANDSQRPVNNQRHVEEDVVTILRSEEAATEKEQLVLARIGQGKFRSSVLGLWSNRCAVTGSTLALRASHIKPWRDCSNIERLDPNNGLPLVATLDSLFDAHLTSFNTDGCIMLADVIPKHEQDCLGIDASMRLRKQPSAETERYLEEHRQLLNT